MLEIIMFVGALVVGNVIGALVVYGIMMKCFMNKKTIKNYTKLMMEISEEIVEEMNQ